MSIIRNIFNPPPRELSERDRQKVLEQLGEKYIHDTSEDFFRDPLNPQRSRARYSNGVDFSLRR